MRWSFFALVPLALAAACSERPTPVAPALRADRAGGAADSDWVNTPVGRRPRECVHVIPDGAHVDPDGTVTRSDGSSYQLHWCNHPTGRAGGKPGLGVTQPVTNGWIEQAYLIVNSGRFSKLTADWYVPPSPTGFTAGQYSYSTFPGLQTYNFILQPVINFNGSYWQARSWHCDDGTTGNCTVGNYIQIAAGDLIHGSVTASNCANGQCTWTVVAQDARTGQSATWTGTDTDYYFYAVGGAVETYGITTCSMYPSGGAHYFNIALYDGNGQQVTPTWSHDVYPYPDPSCNFAVRSTPTTVDLCHSAGMVVNTTSTTPSPAVQYQPFSITINGCGFDPATVQVQLAGPGTNSCPCTLMNGFTGISTSPMQLVVSPLTLSIAGTYYVWVRNGTSGSWSGGQPITVRSRY